MSLAIDVSSTESAEDAARPLPGAPRLLPGRIAASPPPFVLRASMNQISEAPGKVWFFELAAAVIDADRCVQCGACIAACPSDSLAVSPAGIPELVKMCTGCSLCWDFCPRGGLRYEATWLDDPKPATEPGRETAVLAGYHPSDLGALVGLHAARVRASSGYRAEGGQDGSVVTAVLLGALEAGAIDGAVVAQEDPHQIWRGVPVVATTPEQIADAAGSFYNQTMALAALQLESAGLGGDARIAVVGTPCEIQAIRALQQRAWRRGASRVDAVVLTIALLCTKSFDYSKLMLDELAARRGLDLSEVTKVDVIRGRLVAEGLQGEVLVDEPVKAFHGAALKGCDECADFLGRAADISVGSVGSPDGWSSVLVRTAAGAEALARVAPALEMAAVEHPEALVKLDRLDKKAAAASLRRPLEPDGPLFIDFADHLAAYQSSDRQPVWRHR